MKTIQLAEDEDLILIAKAKFPAKERIFLLHLREEMEVKEFDLLGQEKGPKRKGASPRSQALEESL